MIFHQQTAQFRIEIVCGANALIQRSATPILRSQLFLINLIFLSNGSKFKFTKTELDYGQIPRTETRTTTFNFEN